MTNPPLPQPSEPTCRKCGHPASDSVHGLFSGGCLETEAGIYRHALIEMQAERDRQYAEWNKTTLDMLRFRDERDEALRYGRSADSVIADLRDQLAAYHLFPIDALMDEGIHQARRIITSAAGYRFGDDLVPFDEHFKALALDAIAAAHRSAVVALVDGDREQEGTVVPTTRYMECKCLPDSHVPPNPFCEVHGRPSIAAPSGQGVGEDYRSALVTVMAHTGRCGMDGHTHDLSLANGLLDSIARIVNAALSTPPAEAPQEDTRDAKLWRWFRDRAWVGTNEDGEIDLAIGIGEPEELACLTAAERETFTNDSPDREDMPSLCQRIAEERADVPAALPAPRPREEGTNGN